MNLIEGVKEWEERFEDAYVEEFEEVEVTEGDIGERFTRILQRIMLAPKELEQNQKHESLELDVR